MLLHLIGLCFCATATKASKGVAIAVRAEFKTDENNEEAVIKFAPLVEMSPQNSS